MGFVSIALSGMKQLIDNHSREKWAFVIQSTID